MTATVGRMPCFFLHRAIGRSPSQSEQQNSQCAGDVHCWYGTILAARIQFNCDEGQRTVFWIVDNGSSHRGLRAVERLRGNYPNLVLVHGPVHASWLNQIEIYFSIIQRKVLTPNDFSSMLELAERLLAFERHYETIARPFQWRFTRQDLARMLQKLGQPPAKAA